MFRHIHYNFEPVLPTVYTDALSEGETVWKLIHNVNCLISKVNELKIYHDQDIEQLNENLREFILTTDKNNRHWTQNLIKGEHQYNVTGHAKLKAYITEQIRLLNNIINKNNAYLKAWVQVEIGKIPPVPTTPQQYLKNPTTGYVEPLQKIVDDLWRLLRYGGITCFEYDLANLTCAEYDNLNISCQNYDLFAKWIIFRPKSFHRKFLMNSPYTGEKTFYKFLIYKLFEYHRVNGMTCGEYDDLNLTTKQYDSFKITAYQYDWDGKNILHVVPPEPDENEPGFVDPRNLDEEAI